ncbi:BQ5605_C038g11702 [Microbotryum silenes-dioicae]|uniref:BQ5605_C038g11702 protein n=1 Tax=Microbotryum silenes-dioicae TaxID=796604 RepID=A0A2X0PFZ2_9BASI|nr:BQ5605_C038g11702 [Microbotryum silenes-dioicae]
MRSFFVIVAVVCTVGSAFATTVLILNTVFSLPNARATSATPTQPAGFKKLRRSPDAEEFQLETGGRLHNNW